jgi:hypothetical protein
LAPQLLVVLSILALACRFPGWWDWANRMDWERVRQMRLGMGCKQKPALEG